MRPRSFAVAAVLVVVYGAMLTSARAGAQAPRHARVMRAGARGADEITIDGRLVETAWTRVAPSGDFVERVPARGRAPPVRTEIRVLFDENALYVGARMELLPGEVPHGDELRRDSYLIWSDDAVTMKFDVNHDLRTTVGFAVNAAGAQLDFFSVDNGEVTSIEYDAVWESATHVDLARREWTLEVRLPVAALGIAPSERARIIGFNVSRDHFARRATYDWTLIPEEFDPFAALWFGELHGLRGIAGGRPFSVQPYALIGYPPEEGAELPIRARAGGDVRLRLGDQIWSELTVLTDFAQVEQDAAIVNLDRFPLFLPEKRPFFLSGLEVFAFGVPGEAQIFFSRRIGLDDSGREIPMWGGLKAYGRAGPVSFGVLDVLTAPASAPSPEVRSQNFAVSRLLARLGRHETAGAMFVVRNDLPIGGAPGEAFGAEPQYAVGVDGSARPGDERFEVGGFAAATAGSASESGGAPVESTEGLSLGASAKWRGIELSPELTALYVSDDFAPAVGFVRRSGILDLRASLPWSHRVPGGAPQQYAVEPSVQIVSSNEGDDLLALDAGLDFGWEWASGWGASAAAHHSIDTVEAPFELVPGVEIAAGVYEGENAGATIWYSPYVTLSISASDAFFGGVVRSVTPSVSIPFGSHLRVGASGTGSSVSLPGHATFETLALNTNVTIAVSTALFADLVFQLQTVAHEAVGIARLRWRYLPGSDAFLVYRLGISYGDPRSTDHSVILKASYRYDTVL